MQPLLELGLLGKLKYVPGDHDRLISHGGELKNTLVLAGAEQDPDRRILPG